MWMKWLLVVVLLAMPQQPTQAGLVVRRVAGQTRDRMENVVPGVRLELDADTAPPRMLAILVSDEKGNFDFGDKVPRGDYILVATYPGLCTARIPIAVSPKAPRGKLALRMEYPGLDVCSSATLK